MFWNISNFNFYCVLFFFTTVNPLLDNRALTLYIFSDLYTYSLDIHEGFL
jgi:hypothetical protein